MISKKLLSVVLDRECIKVLEVDDERSLNYMLPEQILIEYVEKNIIHRINIYELAFKCKDWIYDQGNGVEVALEHPAYTITCNVLFAGQVLYTITDAEDEPRAVFRAAQWVLERRP